MNRFPASEHEGGARTCPIRADAPVTCASFVALANWLAIRPGQFCSLLGISPTLWTALRRAADDTADFPRGPPLVGATHALVARWIVARSITGVDPLRKAGPADLYAALASALLAPLSLRLFGMLLGRDASAASVWCRAQHPRNADPIVKFACAVLMASGDGNLPHRWKAWEEEARREAALRGLGPIELATSWLVPNGPTVVPRGRHALSPSPLQHRAALTALPGGPSWDA